MSENSSGGGALRRERRSEQVTTLSKCDAMRETGARIEAKNLGSRGAMGTRDASNWCVQARARLEEPARARQ
ncbi:hypothetical protein [Paraburkholderia acidisoli]|uniref:Uncharacterized protein n=1 Tax=Paraburkholderia acidisoli TaxID=2571748 RepID=A0A7Z2JJ18_9BURK|nr:hypothetical protein [Paraburkholderia acidisoli]QGZ64910.1 hypothetical protein FAZ98_24200 [Paraburkholderia acidisoli]